MTKLLALTGLLLSFLAGAQSQAVPVPSHLAGQSTSARASLAPASTSEMSNLEQRATTRIHPNAVQQRAGFAEMIIGNTQYDGQTNACMPNRIVNDGDHISAAWIQSLQVTPFLDRGTGYNSSQDNVGGMERCTL